MSVVPSSNGDLDSLYVGAYWYKEIFSKQGIPIIVRSGNGPQLDSEDFRNFSEEHSFDRPTSSPHHIQGNGFVERGVNTMKQPLQKSSNNPHREQC